MQPVKHVTTCKPSLSQLNLDSPQGALSNVYRVWGVKVTLGYEGKLSSYLEVPGTVAPRAHYVLGASGGLVLLTTTSLFVLLGTCLERIVGAIFATKVSFSTNPFGRTIAEISFASRTCKHRAFTSVIQIECLLLLSARR